MDQYPRICIDLAKIRHNLAETLRHYSRLGINVTPVTKGVGGAPEIARLFAEHDIHSLGDTHLLNIEKMQQAGIETPFMLLRSPMLREAEQVAVKTAYSLNSELAVIRQLDHHAARYDRSHRIILMVELGDRREGVNPENVDRSVREILELGHIQLAGIGANLTCLNGVTPTAEKMAELAEFATDLREKHSLTLALVSGGNSANYQWSLSAGKASGITHMRIGESILLGTDPVAIQPIPGLQTGAFRLEASVIEAKAKPTRPAGKIAYDAFGNVPVIKDEGIQNRVLLAIGRQDLDLASTRPVSVDVQIVGATSDHLVVHTRGKLPTVGDVLAFHLGYKSMLRLMLSPYVHKCYLKT